MTPYTFERLDLACEPVRARYEEAFYASFARMTSNRLIHALWLWNHEAGRLATRIPYDDQCIFAMCSSNGDIAAALAFNVAMKRFQSEAFCFAPPQEPQGSFEVLTFFCPADRQVLFKFHLWEQSQRVLAAQGFHTGLTTTARRTLGLYRRIGWKVIAFATIAGEERFFLRYRIPEEIGLTGTQREALSPAVRA